MTLLENTSSLLFYLGFSKGSSAGYSVSWRDWSKAMVGFDVITSSLKFSFRHDCQYKLSLLNRWFRKFPRGRWIINNEICASSKPFMLIPWPCWPGGRNARKNSSQTSLKIWGPFPTRYILVALCTCREKTSISFGRGSWWNHSSMRLNYYFADLMPLIKGPWPNLTPHQGHW